MLKQDNEDFTQFCFAEYFEYLAANKEQPQVLSFEDYVSDYRYILIEKWRTGAQPKLH